MWFTENFAAPMSPSSAATPGASSAADATRNAFWWQVKLKMKTGNNFKMRGVDRLDGGQTG